MEIPCKNCITLSICLGDVQPKHSGTALRNHIEGTLMLKCPLLTRFVYDGESEGSYSRYHDVVQFFKKITGSKCA